MIALIHKYHEEGYVATDTCEDEIVSFLWNKKNYRTQLFLIVFEVDNFHGILTYKKNWALSGCSSSRSWIAF